MPRPLDPRVELVVPCRKCVNGQGEVKPAYRFSCEDCDGKRVKRREVSLAELKQMLDDT